MKTHCERNYNTVCVGRAASPAACDLDFDFGAKGRAYGQKQIKSNSGERGRPPYIGLVQSAAMSCGGSGSMRRRDERLGGRPASRILYSSAR